MEKVKIWGAQIPYNSEKSKLTDMDIKKAHSKTLLMLRFVFGLKGETYKDKKTLYDTFTYYQQIAGGFEKDTYEDEPYIVPFPVPDSKQTVLVVPGGGFAYKQTDCDGEGNQSEGDLMAKELNKQNISAFVLWYRTNPYRFPVPLVDMQRAVRYIRFHASDYGIRPDTISAVGFSAGGFEVAGLINLIRGKNLFPMDYNPDEIDWVSDEIASAGLVYPCLGFHYLMPLLSACFSPEEIDTEKKRQEITHKYSCTDNFNSSDIPQFLCYGGKDALIVKEHTMEYISKLEETGTRHEVRLLPKANHGFGASLKSRRKYGDWIPRYIDWLKREVTV